jgi:hypothetical protein
MGRSLHVSTNAWFTQSILVALGSRRRYAFGMVKGMPIVAVLRRAGIPPVLYGDSMWGIHRVIGGAVFTPEKDDRGA